MCANLNFTMWYTIWLITEQKKVYIFARKSMNYRQLKKGEEIKMTLKNFKMMCDAMVTH